jgi:hypothetical protein
MIDFSFIPQTTAFDCQVFTQVATVTNLQWLTWRKPRGFQFAWMLCVGGGGGGCGGSAFNASIGGMGGIGAFGAGGGGGGGGTTGGTGGNGGQGIVIIVCH